MTVAGLYQSIADGGASTIAAIAAGPLAIGVIAWLLRQAGQRRASQSLCNFGIALAFATVVLELLALIYVITHLEVDVLAEVDLLLLLLPTVLVIEAFLVEHLLHPGKQELVRQKIRGALLLVIILGVLFFILGKLKMYMLIWSSMTGFIVFVALIIAALYYVVRRVM
ncbi:MAG: hypothetical protein KC636_03940 [Myxococcales bacterium]|nr:hypothetical protein [Myxococcales bacterium]